MSKTLKWEKFQPMFGDWADKIKPFFDQEGFDPIYEKLKNESKDGKIICPESINVFRAFEKCSYKNLKCVILAQDPYPWKIGTDFVADGLAFSCGNTQKLQPSLIKLYEAIEDDLYDGLNLEWKEEQSLEYLAKQGVLLLNSSLTARLNEIGSHKELWRPFITFLLENVLAYTSGISYILMGAQAQSYIDCIPPFSYTFEIEHPSYAARQNRKMIHKKVFSEVNSIIEGANGKEFIIQWLNKISDEKI